jgi:hypothetical protein
MDEYSPRYSHANHILDEHKARCRIFLLGQGRIARLGGTEPAKAEISVDFLLGVARQRQ